MIFNDLIDWYDEVSSSLSFKRKNLQEDIESKSYEHITKLNMMIKCLEIEESRLKKILIENFKPLIENEIPLLEIEYKKQQDFSKSAWDSYGSELAGDFCRGEKTAFKKLQMFKDLLK